jgi:broad specificity phosphatase PhoE
MQPENMTTSPDEKLTQAAASPPPFALFTGNKTPIMNQDTITTVYFVRHGQTAANATGTIQGQTDVPLDETGLKQAELVGARLKNFPFDVIYSSDLCRAAVTAGKIAGGRTVIRTPRLREWDLGHWQGVTISEIKLRFPEEYNLFAADSPDFHPENGESSREFQQRAGDFMHYLAANHPGQKILCVSHGGFMVKVLNHVLQCGNFPKRPRMDNTCIAVFSTADGGANWQLITWNDTAHLESEALDNIG